MYNTKNINLSSDPIYFFIYEQYSSGSPQNRLIFMFSVILYNLGIFHGF